MCLALLLLLAAPETYTPEELEALDRALHAGNLDRRDLTFDKAQAQGYGCLPVVLEMLRDPLKTAPEMDRLAAAADTPLGALAEAARLLGAETWPPLQIGGGSMTPEQLLDILAERVSWQPPVAADLPGLAAEMAWHPVDGVEPPERSRAEVHAKAAQLPVLQKEWARAFGFLPNMAGWIPRSAFPADAPLVRDTPFGRVALGTPKDDVWTGDYAAIIDPGGNDRYEGRIAAAYGEHRVGFLADLHGDDLYEGPDVSLGAAVHGIAALFDLGQGNDRYKGGHVSLGAAVGGVAVLYDDGGSDVYEGKTFTQGAAAFGIGILFDDATQPGPETTPDEGTKDPVDIARFDNDRLTAWANAQAFARPRGVALCVNRRGNDVYEAGGVYLHAPLFADRYQSFAQGFAIGSREIDWAGGVALLLDYEGNDRYLGDVYNQGVGYWYSAGLLWDGRGNDTYEMTQYGQGSGIHLAVGGLVDAQGNDTYVMHSGLGQGGSHDYAASILHDRGGNDRYLGATSCNGCGLTNAVGLFIDRSGDDTYAARREGGLNWGRPARDFPSIGVFLDLGGKDDYLGPMEDGGVWRHSDLGVGADLARDGVGPAGGEEPPPGEPPAICRHEGPLTEEVFAELWALAVRWEVGENRAIVPAARARLAAFGDGVLPYLDARVETDDSGLELRAFVDVLRGLPGRAAFLRANATHASERRRKVALHVIGELREAELADVVVRLLADEALARRAAGVLAAVGSHAGDGTLVSWLDGPNAGAAVSALVRLEADVYGALRPLLASPDFSVRGRLVTLLAEHFGRYGEHVLVDLEATADVRALRSILDVLARAEWEPSPDHARVLAALVRHEDWGVRGDAARVIRRRAGGSPEAVAALKEQLAAETEPYVRDAAR